MKDQRARELEELKMEMGRVKADADMQMEALRSQLEDQTRFLQSVLAHAR